MFRFWSWAATLLIGLQVAGCYTDFGPVVVPTDPIPTQYTSTLLHVGDRIKVTVYGEENLNGVYDVNPAGNVAIPLAGNVRAAGRSTTELQREITRLYKSRVSRESAGHRRHCKLAAVLCNGGGSQSGRIRLPARPQCYERRLGGRRPHLSRRAFPRSHSARRRGGVERVSVSTFDPCCTGRSNPSPRAVFLRQVRYCFASFLEVQK